MHLAAEFPPLLQIAIQGDGIRFDYKPDQANNPGIDFFVGHP